MLCVYSQYSELGVSLVRLPDDPAVRVGGVARGRVPSEAVQQGSRLHNLSLCFLSPHLCPLCVN